MAEKLRQADFQAFEKLYNAVRRANKQDRQEAVGLLTPELIRAHLKSGKPLVLQHGKSGMLKPTILEEKDLLKISRARDRLKETNLAGLPGLPVLALDKASLAADKTRMQEQIRNALLYRVRGNVLHFQVSASPQSDRQHHQVRIRLEEWSNQLHTGRTWLAAARNACVGRISYECDCGRHQYWFRYIATISGCAISPLENDFPKIRNRNLEGMCCKHVLKVLQQLKSGSVHKKLADIMAEQAKSAGYGDKKTKFLNAKDLANMKRAKGSDKESRAALKAFRDFEAARDALKKKRGKKGKSKSERRKMEEENRNLKATNRRQKAQLNAYKAKRAAERKKAERDALAKSLSTMINVMVVKYKAPKDSVMADFAEENKITVEDVQALVEEYSL